MNQNEMHILSPRGVLALLVHPKHHRLPASVISNGVSSIRMEATHRLDYFETDSIAPRLTRSHKRRRKKEEEFSTEDLESQSMSLSPNSSQRFYHPREGEFTLFYFCEMNCNNSRRFTMILANFMQAMDKDDQNESTSTAPIQLICVPNDENASSLRWSPSTEATIFSHLASQAAFWNLGYDHINRLAVIRMLSASMVPSVIVINNKTGKVVTRQGVEAIEASGKNAAGTKFVLDDWRNGRAGISITSRILNCCNIL